jgi:putative YphP/YqiW family bacilliredoxin
MFSRQQQHPAGGGMYDANLVQPMREEVTRLGVKELKTPEEVDQAVRTPGTALVFVNSVCGCAAAGARPGLSLALMHKIRPDNLYTVFAGMEREAVARAREYFQPYQPSSPQIALLKDGKIVHMMQRHDIEGRDPQTIAQSLSKVFDEHCKK